MYDTMVLEQLNQEEQQISAIDSTDSIQFHDLEAAQTMDDAQEAVSHLQENVEHTTAQELVDLKSNIENNLDENQQFIANTIARLNKVFQKEEAKTTGATYPSEPLYLKTKRNNISFSLEKNMTGEEYTVDIHDGVKKLQMIFSQPEGDGYKMTVKENGKRLSTTQAKQYATKYIKML